jgi:hypothetical protein
MATAGRFAQKPGFAEETGFRLAALSRTPRRVGCVKQAVEEDLAPANALELVGLGLANEHPFGRVARLDFVDA